MQPSLKLILRFDTWRGQLYRNWKIRCLDVCRRDAILGRNWELFGSSVLVKVTPPLLLIFPLQSITADTSYAADSEDGGTLSEHKRVH